MRPAISKRRLELSLEKLKILETPDLKLEQYPVSAQAAAELLYMAGFEHHDLQREVIDLGTGTGRLAIGATMVGASHVVGVDVDERAIMIARENALAAGVKVDWIVSDIAKVAGKYDTVIMNPPYGTRSAHLDTKFLDRAFELAPTTYSIHKSSTRDYLSRFMAQRGRKIDSLRSLDLRIPHLFAFHDKKWESVQVDLYRIES